MTDFADKALLPAGMTDVLPPDAQVEVTAVERLMGVFAGHGYQRVKPPLIEFESSLLSGNGAAMTDESFRLMDPVSQRMMCLRSDMTLQVARIATTRLVRAPRPLRLRYAGQVLRVRGSQLRPERQFGQVGAEIIGVADAGADAEVILMAIEALGNLAITGLSVDIGMPTLVPAACAGYGLDETAASRLREALDRKDAAAVDLIGTAMPAAAASVFSSMLAAAGPADAALTQLNELDLPSEAATERAALVAVVERVTADAPAHSITVDAVENRGFEYHTGVTFTFFADGVRGELGRGGRYQAGTGADHEPATGLTLFMDTILRAMPNPAPERRIYIADGTPASECAGLRSEGWITVVGYAAGDDGTAEARRLGCTHVLADGAIAVVEPNGEG